MYIIRMAGLLICAARQRKKRYSRHSMRQFESKSINIEDVEKAIKIAQKAPTACNRQASKVYLYKDKATNDALGELIAGNTGFQQEVPNYLVVTADVSAFYDTFERNQVYVEAGLFSMALVEALHYYGIGSCILQNGEYSFHMPLFFLAAGWVYKEKSVLIDIKRRIQTIVVPYFSFGLLVLLYWQVIERRFRNSDMSFMDSLLGLFSGCYDNLDFNVHLWFLPCFFVTVALFNILVNLGGKKIAYIVSALMSLIYVVLPITLAICSIAYEVIIRIAPWMVGKRHNKAKKMSICG